MNGLLNDQCDRRWKGTEEKFSLFKYNAYFTIHACIIRYIFKQNCYNQIKLPVWRQVHEDLKISCRWVKTKQNITRCIIKKIAYHHTDKIKIKQNRVYRILAFILANCLTENWATIGTDTVSGNNRHIIV